jgi:hypothetical protein
MFFSFAGEISVCPVAELDYFFGGSRIGEEGRRAA